MTSVLHIPGKKPDVLQQLTLFRDADSPDVYGLHEFIESVIGGSVTKKDFQGTIRVIADEGRLHDFAAVVDRFERMMKDVESEDDRCMFGHLITEAREAIRTLQAILDAPPTGDVSLRVIQTANNTWNAAADIHRLKQAS